MRSRSSTWRKGFRFSTYATLWIRQAIGRALDERGRAIRVPVRLAQEERKLARAERELATRLGRQPDFDEVIAAAGLTPERAIELRDAPRAVTSLDRPVDDSETSLGALLPGHAPPPDEEVHLILREQTVRDVVSGLPGLERDVIRLRYGLDGDRDPASVTETARRLGLPQAEVRGLERRALAQLAIRREVAALREAA